MKCKFYRIFYFAFLFSLSAIVHAQDSDNYKVGVNTIYRTDLTDDGSKVQIDLELKADSYKGVGNLTIYQDGKKAFELFHYDNPEQEKDGYAGDFENLSFVKLRKDGKTEILLGIHESSDGGAIHLIEWNGKEFAETLLCSDRYEFKDLDGDGNQEVVTFDRYSAGGPSIYAYDYLQKKYVLSTYEYPDYLKQYAGQLEQGKEAEKQNIIEAFSKGGGYVTFTDENLFNIYYRLGEFEKMRKDFQFFYEEIPKAHWNQNDISKSTWNSLPSEEVEAQNYLNENHNPQIRSYNGELLLRGSAVEKYRILLGLRTLAQKNIDGGKAFYRLQRYDESIAEYQKAINIDPDDWDAYGLMGYSYLRNYQVDKAISFLEKSIEINPAYGMGHYNLALAYWSAGQTEKALDEVKKAIKVDPDLKVEIKEDSQFRPFEKEEVFREAME